MNTSKILIFDSHQKFLISKKTALSFWDVLAWIVLVLLVFWLILKMFGIINTPILIEYAPYFGIAYLGGWAMHTLARATRDIRDIKRNLSFLNKKTTEIDKDLEIIKEKCKK